MANESQFLDKLVNMTAIHDLELMEFSLLKTLEEFIKAPEMLILKFDRNGQPCYQLILKKGKYEIVWEDFSISENTLSAIKVARKSEQTYSCRLDVSTMLTVCNVLRSKSQDVFLVAKTASELNELDSHMINGLLGVYRNFYTVISESQHDQLTGLANRKTFDDVIKKLYKQGQLPAETVPVERRGKVEENNVGFWLGMADLDNFKRINDTWGHMYGDEVLLLTSQLMQETFRETDYLFRFGGEEFVIITCAPDAEKAYVAFERFRVAMAENQFPQIGQVTISIGVTKMDPRIFTATLLDQADKAMYYAKQNGRNQLWFYEKLLEQGLLEENEIVAGQIELF